MEQAERQSVGRFGSLLGIIGNSLMIIIKLIVGAIGKSQGLIAEAIHSGADLLCSLGAFIGITIGNRPADEEHPFGHGKAESIAAIAVATALTLAGLDLIYSGIMGIIQHIELVPSQLTFWVALGTVVYNGGMSTYRLRLAKKINSPALLSDAMNQRVDTLSCAAVAIGIFFARIGYPMADHIAAAIVSFFVLKVAWELLRMSINQLMDKTDPSCNEKVISILKTEPRVLVIEQVRTRSTGSQISVDVKFQVDNDLSVWEAHELALELEDKILNEIKDIIDVTTHYGPIETENMRHMNKKLAKTGDKVVSIGNMKRAVSGLGK